MGGDEFDETDDDDEYDGMDDDEYDDEWELNCKRNDDFILIASVTAAAIYHRRRRAAYCDKMSCRTNKLQGAKWVAEILHGHPDRCYQTFRMKKEIFRDLCYQLRDKYMLRTSNYVQIPKMVGMFLFTLGHCAGNGLVQECFQHSRETVSRMFHEVLHSVYLLLVDIIKPRENQLDEVPVRIRGDRKYSPFKNCVGVIDGTHIPAMIPKPDRGRFIDRMDQHIDARVFQDAISTRKLRFPMPPRGKYYLVDAGYPNKTGFLHPIKVRGIIYLSSKMVAEQQVLMRFPILRKMPSYPYETQVQIVIACMTLHNFIRWRVTNDEEFTETDEGASSSSQEPTTEDVVIGVDDLRDDRTMSSVRDKIADKLVRRRQR
ncbi:uncharacterized protein LOC119996976 [Tripterygium wilfordii]|uniref:uncharacterized protein LOC119996976 n=1 Tax=Tripterygium wilfordii TaxID=458696 RepID=UPI0018F834E7|nr:uncharacterized protein LOC119996976 [Tripterygium wilfordii]